ncbi:MAG: hypothetical protein GY703_25145 [Gammaproteobacteria bacterium]|nr:hypothetical protein [Gammaproteobacteria bacterium]
MFLLDTHILRKRSTIFAKLLIQSIPFLLFLVFLFPFALLTRKKSNPWVVNGHKGNYYEDNSKSLHEYITGRTSQKIVWISANHSIASTLRKRGHAVLMKHSFKSRFTIVNAPVLIYSHGEDDLDIFLYLLRSVLGTRIMVSHTLNHLKGPSKSRIRHLVTDFDYILATSEEEKRNITQLYPDKENRIVLGGGAHLDQFFREKVNKKTNTILYFPTHRETQDAREKLNSTVDKLILSDALKAWLENNQFKLVICRHVNSSKYQSIGEENLFINAPPDHLIKHILHCKLFISDYSGTLANFLVLGQPTIFFPFDLEDFLTRKVIYRDYDECRYGPRANSTDELIELITESNWYSDEFIQQNNRDKLSARYFPYSEAVYSAKSYEKIKTLVSTPPGKT